ncbi:uncharacterized protein N7459_001748 [Penicillium hispanicum]|uniref:uncharacterized protein n=1 Tax=Penicillium hispanicum TaxID=1080232 RepID=UPI002541E04A|nr:uncharacterized protein N7459_001748 [Penicillium hispanicum]KAJ5595540.1 hypothetical protein N7459_001748 [Penicillium hispanicum]
MERLKDGVYAGSADQSAVSLEPLAIIGFSGRFAGDATTSENLWKMLLEQRSAAGPVPRSRFNASSYYHPDPDHGATFAAQCGYFLEGDINALDTSLFNLTANEIASMDPQQKLLLESVYHALENALLVADKNWVPAAGVSLSQVAGSNTSVYVGASNNDHLALANADLEMLQKHRATGTCASILSNRAIISGVNLIEHPASTMQLSTLGVLSPDGKCFSFDHRANGYSRGEGVGTVIVKPLAAALRDGDTVRAIVRGTGSNQDGKTQGLSLPNPEAQEALIKQVYAAANLDVNDTGYVEAHGTGTPVGDPLEAKAISKAFNVAERTCPLYIGSVKANLGHLEGGAGMAGLIKVIIMLEEQLIPGLANFEKLNPKLEGLPNVVFPTGPTLWSERAHPRRASINSFGFGGTNSHAILEASTLLERGNTIVLGKWVEYDKLANRLADSGRSSEQEESVISTPPTPPPLHHKLHGMASPLTHRTMTTLIPDPDILLHADSLKSLIDRHHGSSCVNRSLIFHFSAADRPGLMRNAQALKAHLGLMSGTQNKHAESKYLMDLAFTLLAKRSNLRWKTFHVASSVDELQKKLDSNAPVAFRAKPHDYRIGFVFTGQGAQWSKMGSSLLMYPAFRQSIEEASSYLSELGCPYSVQSIFEQGSQDINHPLLSQTMCTVLQVALVELLATWNVLPGVVLGHSSGEIAAAYCSRKITRQAAWKIAYYRGLVSVSLHNRDSGGMMAVGASSDAIKELLSSLQPQFSKVPEIGCVNSPKNITITGEREDLEKLRAACSENDIFARVLPVKVPYHSREMQSVADTYQLLLQDLSKGEKLKTPQRIRMISSLTGSAVEEDSLHQANYWVQNLTSPVIFSDALLLACSEEFSSSKDSTKPGLDELIELGPHSTMRSAIREGLASYASLKVIEYSHILTRQSSSNITLLQTMASLYSRGYPLNLDAVNQASCTSPGDRRMISTLPPYNFNHDNSSRTQTRIMKNIRYPRFPRHELLGASTWDWNEYEPKWRNVLRTSEMPWLKDHQINGNIIYPGVASWIMAIEAASLLKTTSAPVTGYRVKNISYKAALIIPDTKEGLEVSFSMRKTEDVTYDHQPWYEFYLRSFDIDKEAWTEHTCGLVRVECRAPTKESNELSSQSSIKLGGDTLRYAKEKCNKDVDLPSYYGKLHSHGVVFGPTMHNVNTMQISGTAREAIGDILTPSLSKYMPAGYSPPLLLHPTTIESMAHSFPLICTSSMSPLGTELLSTFMEEIWVSSSFSSKPGTKYQAHAWSEERDSSNWSVNMNVWSAGNECQIMSKGTIISALPHQAQEELIAYPCYGISPYLSTDLLTSASAFRNFHRGLLDGKDMELVEKLELLSTTIILNTINELQSVRHRLLPDYDQCFSWMQDTISNMKTGALPLVDPTTLANLQQDQGIEAAFQSEIAQSGGLGRLLVECGKNLVPVLTGQQSPSIHECLVSEAFQERLLGDIEPLLSQYLTSFGKDHSDLRVLEVGTKTSHIAEGILKTLGSSLKQYDLTGVTPELRNGIETQLEEWSDKVQYCDLNLKSDILSQGLQVGSYDIVVAANVSKRARLSGDGKFVLIEDTNRSSMRSAVSFGILPDWWSRTCLTEDTWATKLYEAGFSQDPLVFHDTNEQDAQESTLFISTAVDSGETVNSKVPKKCFIIYSSDERRNVDIGSLLKTEFASYSGMLVQTVQTHHLRLHDLQDSVCVVLGLDAINLSTLESDDYNDIQHMLLTCSGLIWVTNDSLTQPVSSMPVGLIRNLRWERHFEDVNFVTLDIADPRPSSRKIVRTIQELFHFSFADPKRIESNGEYTFREEMLWVNQLHPAQAVNDYLQSKFNPQPVSEPLGLNLDHPLKISTRSLIGTKTFQFIEDPSQQRALLDNEVKIYVEAWGLTLLSTTSTNGQHFDVVGKVVEKGSKVHHLDLDNRVIAMSASSDGLGTFLITSSRLTQRIENAEKSIDASVIASTFSTAVYSLNRVADIQPNENVLIHSAANGIGQAAIQIARLAAANIFATVSTVEEKAILLKSYSLQEDQVLYEGDDTFQAAIERKTAGRGLDVVLQTRASAASHASWRCLAPFGRFIDLIKDATSFRTSLDMLPFSRGAIYASVDIIQLAQQKPDMLCGVLREVADLYDKSQIHCPQPQTQFTFSEIPRAVSLAQEGEMAGSVILKPHAKDIVPKYPPPPQPYQFPANASYVLAGGLGGLGRSIALWMAARGAKNFIFLSRSGLRGDTTHQFIQGLRDKGCRAEVRACDITDQEMLTKTLASFQPMMPPIKGCFQCSMVLRDSMFPNMSALQWQQCVTPKVQGSANLAEALPRDLDFLLLLSSSSAIIGNRGQANYSAANMYMDRLAEHLVRKGFPAMSLNLGSVLSAGWLADNKDSKLSGALSHLTTSEEELLSLIEYHVDPRWKAAKSIATCHTVAGLRDAAYFFRRGVQLPEFFQYPLFTHLRAVPADAHTSEPKEESGPSIKEQLQRQDATVDKEKVISQMVQAISQKLSAMMSIPSEDIEPSRPITSYGVDSLVTMDFKGWIANSLGAKVSTLDLVNGNSIMDLSQKIAKSSGLVSE